MCNNGINLLYIKCIKRNILIKIEIVVNYKTPGERIPYPSSDLAIKIDKYSR